MTVSYSPVTCIFCGGYQPWAYTVDLNIPTGKFVAECFCKLNNPSLRRSIGRSVPNSLICRHRSYVDDFPRPLMSQQLFGHFLSGHKTSFEVDIDDLSSHS
jgi:hypothetical protein